MSQAKHSQETTDSIDTDIDDMTVIHRAKRAKTEGSRYKNQPLRRTGKSINHFKVSWLKVTLETTLESMLIDSESERVLPDDTNRAHDEAITEDDESTPRPKKKGSKSAVQKLGFSIDDDNDDDDDTPFQSPLVLRRKNQRIVRDSDSEDLVARQNLEDEGAYKQREMAKRKRDQIGEITGGSKNKGTMGNVKTVGIKQ